MNRTLPSFLVLAGLCLVGADPNRQQARPASPAPEPQQAADGDAPFPLVELPKLPIKREIKPELYARALPEEREAVRVALTGWGDVSYGPGGHVRSLYCQDVTDPDMKLFAALPELESLYVGPPLRKPMEGYWGEAKVTDAGLTPLLQAKKLRDLSLIEAPITDEGLKIVGQLTKVDTLWLSCQKITDSGLSHLRGLRELKELGLIGCSLADDAMREVAKHAALQRIDLGPGPTHRGLAELVRLPALQTLKLDWQLSDDDLVPVGQMVNLTSLKCGTRKLSNEGLRHIKDLRRVRSLYLGDNEKVNDAGMAFVGQMKGLEELELNRNIGDAGVAHVAGLTNLKVLKLSRTQISDSGVARLTGLSQLWHLNLQHTHVTGKGLLKLRGMKSLRQIDIGYTGISDEDAASLRESGIPAF